MLDYIIEPINGRDVIQKNFVSLPQKANNYSGRHISLNERFSIIERGYHLQATETTDSAMNIKVIARKEQPSREELKKMLLEESEKRRQKREKMGKKTNDLEIDSCDSQPESPK